MLLPLGLNLAAGAALGAILTAGTEPGGLGQVGASWLWPAALATAVGLVIFRFPRSVGLPLVVVMAAGSWLVIQALHEFHPLGPVFEAPLVQPLTDSQTVTVFALRADFLDPPEMLPLVPTLYRLRTGSDDPAEWWWSWAVARGWARSTGAPLPENPLKFELYRLTLTDHTPVWTLEAPELTVPQEASSP